MTKRICDICGQESPPRQGDPLVFGRLVLGDFTYGDEQFSIVLTVVRSRSQTTSIGHDFCSECLFRKTRELLDSVLGDNRDVPV